MITEDNLKKNIDTLKEGTTVLLKMVEEELNAGDYDGAIERIAILNANVLALLVCTDMVNQ